MEILGKSLEDIFVSMPEKKMSIKCVCNIGYQMVNILQYIHDKHIIHRDIKPDNFVVGLGDKAHQIYLLDFGIAKKYRSSTTLNHYPMTNRKKLTGTARYASINALNGFDQSRRDDLEAVGYVLMYFLKGALPWQGLPVKNKEDRYAKIMEKKRDTTAQELCSGFPKELEEYVTYTRNLAYEQDPDYDYLKDLFIIVLRNQNQAIDYTYDWTSSEMRNIAKEQESLKNNFSSAHRTYNNDANPLNGPQITVVNNYYNNVQNILIQSNDKEKEKEKEKQEKQKKQEKEQSKHLRIQKIDTRNNFMKDSNNEMSHLNSKRNKDNAYYQKTNSYNYNKISQENINNRVLNETNQKNAFPLASLANLASSQEELNNENNHNNKENKNNNNKNMILTKKEDNKCCIII